MPNQGTRRCGILSAEDSVFLASSPSLGPCRCRRCGVGTEREMCTLSTVSGFTSRFRGSYRTFFHSASPSAMTVDEPLTSNRQRGAQRTSFTRHRAIGCSALRTGLSAQLREPQDIQVHPEFPPWEAGCSQPLAAWRGEPSIRDSYRRKSSRSTSGTGPVTTSTSVTK